MIRLGIVGAILRRVLPAADADVAIGDLAEDAARRRPPMRWVWLLRQVLSLIAWSLWERLEVRDAPEIFFDLRTAIRGLRRSPGFVVTIVVTVAVGIAGTTTVFALLHGILLAPLEYPEPDRLVVPWNRIWASKSLFRDLEERVESVAGLAAWSGGARVFSNGEDDPEMLLGPEVAAGFLQTLGYAPVHGRFFDETDTEPGAEPVAVLTDELFTGRFGADADIVGDRIRLDGVATTVIGVLPPGARLLQPDARIVVPLRIDPAVREYRTATYLKLVGRLRDGVDMEQASAEIGLIAEELREEYGFSAEQVSTAAVVSLREFLVGDRRPLLSLLMGAVVVLLLAACINAGSLTLARQMSRRPEIAVRTALGGGRLRVMAFLVAESALLAGAGGLAGTALTWWTLAAVRATRPLELPRSGGVHLSPTVLVIAFGVTAMTALAAGLLPALRVSRVPPADALRADRAASMGRTMRLAREALVVAEVALAVVLVSGAGLMGRSLWDMLHVDPGFETENRLIVHLRPPAAGVGTELDIATYYDRMVGAVDELAVTRASAAVNAAPVRGEGWVMGTAIEGVEYEGAAEMPLTYWRAITPAYFDALGAVIGRGRPVNENDTAGSAPAVVVNQSFARRHWPGENAIGKRFRIGWDTSEWLTVVGVVRNIRHLGVDTESPPTAYRPMAQAAPALAGVGVTSLELVIAASGDPLEALAEIRTAIRSADPGAAILNPAGLRDIVRTSLAVPRLLLHVLLGFGAAALLLAAVGIAAVVAQLVRERRHELGIRQALGARPRQVVAQSLLRGLAVGGVGLLLGTLAAVALAPVLSRFLFDVSPRDPKTFVGVVAVLGACVVVASWIPSRSAGRIDPTEALRG